MTWFWACDQASFVGLCMQDYKSLCAAVTICSTLFNIQTYTDSAKVSEENILKRKVDQH